MPRPLLLGALVILVAPLLAEAAAKKPWEWTLEERLAQRFDRAKMQERRATYEADYPQTKGTHGGSSGVDGRRNPELLVPSELFEGLMSAYVPDLELRGKQRWLWGRGIRAMGFDDKAFWPKLESIASDYLELRYGALSERQAPDQRDLVCRARYRALQNARNTFGGFDMLLYTVVAPTFQSSSSDPTKLARLRAQERGCQ